MQYIFLLVSREQISDSTYYSTKCRTYCRTQSHSHRTSDDSYCGPKFRTSELRRYTTLSPNLENLSRCHAIQSANTIVTRNTISHPVLLVPHIGRPSLLDGGLWQHLGSALRTRIARLRGMAKGMSRLIGEAEKRPRFGVRTQDLAEAMRSKLGNGSAAEANWRAAFAVAFCALMRGGEVGVEAGAAWTSELHLTRADVSFFRDYFATRQEYYTA